MTPFPRPVAKTSRPYAGWTGIPLFLSALFMLASTALPAHAEDPLDRIAAAETVARFGVATQDPEALIAAARALMSVQGSDDSLPARARAWLDEARFLALGDSRILAAANQEPPTRSGPEVRVTRVDIAAGQPTEMAVGAGMVLLLAADASLKVTGPDRATCQRADPVPRCPSRTGSVATIGSGTGQTALLVLLPAPPQ